MPVARAPGSKFRAARSHFKHLECFARLANGRLERFRGLEVLWQANGRLERLITTRAHWPEAWSQAAGCILRILIEAGKRQA